MSCCCFADRRQWSELAGCGAALREPKLWHPGEGKSMWQACEEYTEWGSSCAVWELVGSERRLSALPALLTPGNPAEEHRTCHLVFASAFQFNTF